MANPKLIRVTLTLSPSGVKRNQRACVAGLGLRRIRHTVLVEDTPSIRGMINKARHLLQTEEVWDFTRLNESERAELERQSDTLSKIPMEHAIPIYFADMSQDANEEENLNSGTGSLIRIDGRQYCVTNEHVLRYYSDDLKINPKVRFWVGDVQLDPFDPDVLVSKNRSIDLAVLDLSGYSVEDIAIGGEIPKSFLDIDKWSPELPKVGSFVMFGGYPKVHRSAGSREVEFGAFGVGAVLVHDVDDRNIICHLEMDRSAMHDAGVPSEAFGELGGISGGPVLQKRATEGSTEVLDVVGFIFEHEDTYDALRIRPATCLEIIDGKLKLVEPENRLINNSYVGAHN